MDVGAAWWIGTLALLGVLLAVDLGLSGRHPGIDVRRSLRWVLFYVAVALVFAVVLGFAFDAAAGGQFVAGWLTEYSLSVDNLFVFMILMSRFAVPEVLQLRVLSIGIVLALVLRGILIAVGAAALDTFSWLFYVFAAFLLYTAVSLLRGGDSGGSEEPPRITAWIRRVVPSTPEWHGGKALVHSGGRWRATPLVVTMLAIGVTDVLFALDSIPAIFGLTREPFLVFTANAFALLGLRELFFVVRHLLDRLVHLEKGLSVVIGFIGVKLVLEALHENSLPFINNGEPLDDVPVIPTWLSLAVIVVVLAATAVTSLISSRRRDRGPVRAS